MIYFDACDSKQVKQLPGSKTAIVILEGISMYLKNDEPVWHWLHGGMTLIYENILPILLAADLLIPFLLAPTYKDYNHLTKVMSALGNPKAPLHLIYNIWLVVLGISLLISAFPLYADVAETSKAISVLLFFVIAVYAIGGCILSGLFAVGETKNLETVSAKIHGFGSVIGFLLLTFASLLIGIYFFIIANSGLGILSLICFALAVVFFTLFVMADKPNYQGTIIRFEGLWQRLSLFCMYFPIAVFCYYK